MIRIDLLPDDVLLDIFDFHASTSVDMSSRYYDKKKTQAWQSLVHVCRRWRTLIFGSPRRLDLKLYLSPKMRTKGGLDIWPALPLIIYGNLGSSSSNTIAALEQSNRVREIALWGWELQEFLALMQVPFPELTDLQLLPYIETPVILDSFLGGSAPRLRFLRLDRIPFPGLPKLLLSATHLVQLQLDRIPHSGYISPQAMVAPLSMLSSLEELHLGFQSPQSRPDWESQSLPPPRRSILPALTKFRFKGVTEYLEDLMTHIDTPQLDEMHITFFNQIDFDCPRLAQFINCTPTLRVLDEAHVQFADSAASVRLRSRTHEISFGYLLIDISCKEPDWQLSSIEQVSNFVLRPLSAVEDLYIEDQHWEPIWKNEVIESTLWLQLLLPFTAVKKLFLSKEFAPGIAVTLQELVGGRITEVLPSLQNIFVNELELSGSFHETIMQFVATRRLSNHPIAIFGWNKDSYPGWS